MRALSWIVGIGLVTPLLACSGLLDEEALQAMAEGVPPPSANWVGEWDGAGTYVAIAPDGSVVIETTGTASVNTATSVRAPAQSWDDGELVVGIGMFTTTWRIDEAPYERDGEWRMVMEGTPLVRRVNALEVLATEGAPPATPAEPEGVEVPPAAPDQEPPTP